MTEGGGECVPVAAGEGDSSLADAAPVAAPGQKMHQSNPATLPVDTRAVQADIVNVFRRVCCGNSTAAEAMAGVEGVEAAHPRCALPTLLIDLLPLMEAECDGEGEEKEKRVQQWNQLLQLCREKYLPDAVLEMELEGEKDVKKGHPLVRFKTKLYFKQSKFNLLREESEGWAKLAVELLDEAAALPPSAMLSRVLALIGQFNLDPNRVTDIIMECFECQPYRKTFFVGLLNAMKVNREYICTLLGFKYTFYQKDDAELGRCVAEGTPFSLYDITATLITHNIVHLNAIIPYMVPRTANITDTHKARVENATKRAKKAETIMTSKIAIAASKNRDETSCGGMETEQATIVGHSFSAVAAQQEAEDAAVTAHFSQDAILSSNQRLGLICALVEQGAWSTAQPLIDKLPEFYAVHSSTRVANAITAMVDAAIDSFYADKCSWSQSPRSASPVPLDDRIDRVSSWQQLLAITSLLNYVGPYVAYRPKTTSKLLRLVTTFFQERERNVEGTTDELAAGLMSIVDEVLVPAMSLISSVAYSEELWLLLSTLPYAHRFRLYGRWKTIHTLRHPALNIQRGKMLGRIKYVIKRLSKDTVRVMGRLIGKLCHSHPIAVFDCLLEQVQTFDNLIQPVVDAIRFLTHLEFDVFIFCVMEHLSSPSKQQLKSSDGSLSPWLQSLATLIGAVFKKYNVELTGMLHYVANQLKNGKSFDLLILREVIHNMSGIEAPSGATPEQLEALSGGEQLRSEAGGFSSVRNKRAIHRLRDALLKEDLPVPLSILIAQQRECVVWQDSKHLPLKLAGEMVDQCRDTLVQFGSFVLAHVKGDEMAKRLPSAYSLITDYHLPLDSAFYLTRNTYMPQVFAEFDRQKKTMRGSGASTNGEEKEAGERKKEKLDNKLKTVLFKSSVDKVLDGLCEEIRPVIPSTWIDEVPLKTMVAFWALSLYDVDVPVQAYEREMERVRKQAAQLDAIESKGKRSKESERLRLLESKLGEEQRKQNEHVARVRAYLAADKHSLFVKGRSQHKAVFLQMCCLRRAVFSEQDAIYCGKMIEILHQNRTEGFQTLLFIDKTFVDVLPLLSGLSENEAGALGRFLQTVLSMAARWHADEKVFEKECDGFPGFAVTVNRKTPENPSGVAGTKDMKHEEFRKLAFKWQQKLETAFEGVLGKKNADYSLLRNCLVVMTKLLPCFPLLKSAVSSLETLACRVRDAEKGNRDDLSLKAASYAGRLKMRQVQTYERHEFYKCPPEVRKPAPAPAAKAAAKKKVEKKTEKEQPKEKAAEQQEEKKEAVTPKRSVTEKPKLRDSRDENGGPEDGEVTPSPPPIKESPARKVRIEKERTEKEKTQNGGRKEERKEDKRDKEKEERNGHREEKARDDKKEKREHREPKKGGEKEKRSVEKEKREEKREKEERRDKGDRKEREKTKEREEKKEEPKEDRLMMKERLAREKREKEKKEREEKDKEGERKNDKQKDESKEDTKTRGSIKDRLTRESKEKKEERKEQEKEKKEERKEQEKEKEEPEYAGPELPPAMDDKEKEKEKDRRRRDKRRAGKDEDTGAGAAKMPRRNVVVATINASMAREKREEEEREQRKREKEKDRRSRK